MRRVVDIIVQGSDADDIVLRFAAEELATYAERITGEQVGQGEHGPGSHIVLRIDPSVGTGDTFLLRSADDGLVVASPTSRGVLHAVYAYLENLGVRFPFPGADHEVVPRRTLTLDGYNRLEVPSFARRGLTFFGSGDEAFGWIDFCAKQRLNWLFLHSPDPAWWLRQRDRLWPEMRKRGLTLELGGHFLPQFLPRDLFSAHPDWFRVAHGQRVNDFNLCPSSGPALAYLQEQARAYARAAPEAAVYNIWADDTAQDASTWCACDRCTPYAPSDQNLLVMNALAAAIHEVQPSARVVSIAYHETITPPRTVRPGPGVVLMFAPRERCYAHALDDPTCAKNRQHAAWLEELITIFDPNQAEVFEYYTDQYVFNDMAPALPDTIAADLRYYKRLGLGLIEPLLVTFTHPWLTPPASAILHAVAQRAVASDLHAVLADHARQYYGHDEMVDFVERREQAVRRALTVCGFTQPRAAFWTPPLEKPDVTARYLRSLEPALVDLRQARAALARATLTALGPHAWRGRDAERAFDLAGRRINGLIHLSRGLLAYARFQNGGSREDANEAVASFEHAYADLNALRLGDDGGVRTFALADLYIHRIMRDLGTARQVALTVPSLLESLASAVIPERARAVAGTYRLILGDQDGGEGLWTIAVRDGECAVTEEAEGQPLATLWMHASDFVALMRGDLPLSLLRLEPGVEVVGDAARLWMLFSSLRIT